MVHEDTIRDIIDACASIAGSLGKEMVVHRNRMEATEARLDKEIELARAQQRAVDHRHTPEPSPPAGPGVSGLTQQDSQAAIDELIAEEQCSVCRDLLEALKDRPLREQLRGVKEYGEFKSSLSEGADVAELKAVLRKTTVLKSIFEEDLRGAPV